MKHELPGPYPGSEPPKEPSFRALSEITGRTSVSRRSVVRSAAAAAGFLALG